MEGRSERFYVKKIPPIITGFEDGGRSHEPRNTRSVALVAGKGREMGKAKKCILPCSLWRECGLASTLILAK